MREMLKFDELNSKIVQLGLTLQITIGYTSLGVLQSCELHTLYILICFLG